MPRAREARALAAVTLVVGYLLGGALLVVHTWSPAGRDAALLVDGLPGGGKPGLIAGAGLAWGEPWIAVQSSNGPTGYLLGPGWGYRLDGVRLRTACSGLGGIVVAGMRDRVKTVMLVTRGGWIAWRLDLRIAPVPSSCSSSQGRVAILLTDPIIPDRVLLVTRDGSGWIAKIRGLPSSPSRIALLPNGSVVLLGNGFYAVLTVAPGSEGWRLESFRLYNVSIGSARPTLTGAAAYGGGIMLVGSLPETKNARGRGVVYVPGEGWLLLAPAKEKYSLRAHTLVAEPWGARLALEVVGKQTIVADLRGGSLGPGESIVTLAPYILHTVRQGRGYLVITGEVFLRRGGETERYKAAYIVESVSRYALARSPSDAVAITGKPMEINAEPLTNATVTPADPSMASVSVASVRARESLSPLPGAAARASVYTVYVDRELLSCALIAVTAAYAAPLAAAVYRYNRLSRGA